MTAHRIIRWLGKADSHGNYPEWWQWFVPRYGNWGAPGWSGGAWVDDPAKTDWEVGSVDDLDEIFKVHDKAYQDGELWIDADIDMIIALHKFEPVGLTQRLYRAGAIIAFSLHVCYMLITGRWYFIDPFE